MKDLYQEITDKIIASLESGVAPWVKPWSITGGSPRNAVTGRPYSGINLVLLGFNDYIHPLWLTYNQAKAVGAQVRKGEHGTTVVFFKQLNVKDKESSDGDNKVIPLLRSFTVFNIAQIDGLPDKYIPKARSTSETIPVNQLAEECLDAAEIHHGGARACYVPSKDVILLPHKHEFKSAADYYGVALHELTHWTGAKHRLARDFSGRFGDEAYAFEELVAELGAAFLCAHCEVDGKLQHESYIANWLRVLKGDKKAIFSASSNARKAAEFVLPNAEDDAELEQAA